MPCAGASIFLSLTHSFDALAGGSILIQHSCYRGCVLLLCGKWPDHLSSVVLPFFENEHARSGIVRQLVWYFHVQVVAVLFFIYPDPGEV